MSSPPTVPPGAGAPRWDPPIGLEQMTSNCNEESIRLAGSAKAWTADGHANLVAPMQRRADVFLATAMFLDLIRPILPEIKQLLAERRRRGDR